MTWRITEDDVKGVVDTGDGSISLTPFVKMANVLTDKVAAKDTDSELSADDLEQIETLLAAHFYSLRDQRYQSKSTGGASAAYQGQTGQGLRSTDYGTNAIALDSTGFLASMDRGRTKASASWLGKAPSDQTDYEDRD